MGFAIGVGEFVAACMLIVGGYLLVGKLFAGTPADAAESTRAAEAPTAAAHSATTTLASGIEAIDMARWALWAAIFGIGSVIVLFSGQVLVALAGFAVAAVFALGLARVWLRRRVATVQQPVVATTEDVLDGGGTRPCPYCAETIKAAAVVCRWCGRDLTGAK